MSNKLKQISRDMNGNSHQQRIQSIILQNYPNAMVSAFILGQALQQLPQTVDEKIQVATALGNLVKLEKSGVLPPALVGGCQQLDRMLKAQALAETIPPAVPAVEQIAEPTI